MIRAALIINLADRHMLIRAGGIAVDHLAARIGARRKLCGNRERGFAELRRVYAVINERGSQRHCAPGIARRRRERCEVAREHCGCGNKPWKVGWVLTRCCSLVSGKEEQFALRDRSSDGSPELVALDGVALQGEC